MSLFDDTRADWGARAPKAPPTFVSPSRRSEFMSHWNGGPTGLTAASDHARCLAVIKADQDFHMDGRGWNDIGYNGAICPHGRAIECRGIDYSGAHCPDHNTSAYGWQFMLGKGETATPIMFARMARARADCEAHSGHSLKPMGHRDGYQTECPGAQIETWVKAGMVPPPNTTTSEKDWFDMATQADLETVVRKVFADPDVMRNIARFVLTGLPTGPEGEQLVLAGRLSKIEALAAADLTPEQVKAAVVDALGAKYDATVTLTPKPSGE